MAQLLRLLTTLLHCCGAQPKIDALKRAQNAKNATMHWQHLLPCSHKKETNINNPQSLQNEIEHCVTLPQMRPGADGKMPPHQATVIVTKKRGVGRKERKNATQPTPGNGNRQSHLNRGRQLEE